MNAPSVAVVIPAYNAADTLPDVIARFPRALHDELLAIWVVDDGSTDQTVRVIRKLKTESPWPLKLIMQPHNGGYGNAMKRGLTAARAAGASIVACVHADGQYAPELLPALLDSLRKRRLDLLQGSRLASGRGALAGGMPFYKYLAGRALVALENRVLGLGLSDYHSGYMLYGQRALQHLPFTRLAGSFHFDLEVLASAKAYGLRVGEHAIPTHYGDEVSYLDPIRYGVEVLKVMARYHQGHYHPQPHGKPH
ncbi:MAG: glycosyltransferase family 2 protein [Deltaproteobacteria bacterium]|nr:glycosyltransferase family 2 protein [Deltaproteobacteria bacterium]